MGTKLSTRDRTINLAISAAAQHALDYDLIYSGIDTPVVAGDPIVIKVRAVHLDAWLDTVLVDEDPRTKPLGEGHLVFETIRYRCRLTSPIGDVAADLLTVRRHVPLTIVGAAS